MVDPRPFDVFATDCPSRSVLDHVTSRWGALTLAALRPGPRRFNDIARAIGGISDRMLSQTLKTLEGDGLVVRDQQPGGQRVQYALTPQGERIADATGHLIDALYEVMPVLLAPPTADA